MWNRHFQRIASGVAISLAATAGTAQDFVPRAPSGNTPGFEVLNRLSDTVTRPHADIATRIDRPEIRVMPLGAPIPGAVGLLPGTITGLPDDLWGQSDAGTLAELFRAQAIDGLPAIKEFTETLALAELAPPATGRSPATGLFLARVDMLLSRGALDPARALIDRGPLNDPEVFQRRFDIGLLTDEVARACAAMDANPDLAPGLPERIFCLARGGDWSAAVLALGTGEALGQIDPQDADLIARFLDPDLFEGARALSPDPAPTPLQFQLRLALGERPDTTGLPLAFAHADLSDRAGWRAQLEAAERLIRSGAIAPSQWLEIYIDRVPSASGAVWDRVAAVQAFDESLRAADVDAVATTLPTAVAQMRTVGLATAFATVYAAPLAALDLPESTRGLARQLALLSPDYETSAQSVPDAQIVDPTDRMAFAIARGQAPTAPGNASRRVQAVAAAFADVPPRHRYAWFRDNDRLGEALLRAALVLSDPDPDGNDVTDALALYRDVGLEDIARRAALQLVLLEDR